LEVFGFNSNWFTDTPGRIEIGTIYAFDKDDLSPWRNQKSSRIYIYPLWKLKGKSIREEEGRKITKEQKQNFRGRRPRMERKRLER
jgi:hypothetical protein